MWMARVKAELFAEVVLGQAVAGMVGDGCVGAERVSPWVQDRGSIEGDERERGAADCGGGGVAVSRFQVLFGGAAGGNYRGRGAGRGCGVADL